MSVADVVVHVGTHKTGSTALQSFCARNRDAIADQGILYPSQPVRWGGHHQLAWSLGIKHPHAEDISASEAFGGVFVEAAQRDCQTVLVSSEDFEFLPDPQVLRDALGSLDARVVLYLRKQDDYLVSEYNQHVRMYVTRFAGSIDEFYAAHDFRPRFDYTRLVGKWAKVFEQVKPRPFDGLKARDTTIFEDFCETVGIAWSDSFVLPPREASNVSLDSYTTEILRHLNARSATQPDHAEMVKAFQHLTVERTLIEEFGPPPDALPGQLQAELHDTFGPPNVALLEQYPQLDVAGGLRDLSRERPTNTGSPVSIEDLLLFIAPHLLRWPGDDGGA